MLPKKTKYACPVCDFDVVQDEWTKTEADSEGNPNERTGVAYYCTRKECEHSVQPIETDDLLSATSLS